ncbi:MAG: alpha/beta hydrolase [Planctomycetota bacterium]
MNPRLVFLPGLGADASLFAPQLDVLGGETPAWIEPREQERLGDYALRFAEPHATAEPWIAIGFSFGGMVALEAASRLSEDRRPQGVILISGLRSHAAVSLGFKVQRAVGGLVPRGLIRKALEGPVPKAFAKADGLDDRCTEALASMARRADVDFLMWASKACCSWDFGGDCPVPVRHIHGKHDRIIPYVPHPAFEGGLAELADAGHLLTWTAPDQVTGFIQRALRSMMPPAALDR